MGNASLPISLHGVGVQYDMRLSRKRRLRGTLIGKYKNAEAKKFWALRNIDLDVKHGESLAVIGNNGAGKSTLLQTLAGIITPDEGEIEVRGRISTLLNLGAGFEDDLDAEENILLAGEYLGIPHTTIRRKLNEIIGAQVVSVPTSLPLQKANQAFKTFIENDPKTKGFEVTARYHTMGGENLAEIQFQNMELPVENLIITDNGFKKKYNSVMVMGQRVIAVSNFVREHILKGDRGDGIPNFLSPDNTFAAGERQKVLNSKKLQEWIGQDAEVFCTNDTMLRGYKRNQMLVDFDYIPNEIQSKIVSAFEDTKPAPKEKMLTYFIDKGLKVMIESINDF